MILQVPARSSWLGLFRVGSEICPGGFLGFLGCSLAVRLCCGRSRKSIRSVSNSRGGVPCCAVCVSIFVQLGSVCIAVKEQDSSSTELGPVVIVSVVMQENGTATNFKGEDSVDCYVFPARMCLGPGVSWLEQGP